MAEPIRVLIVEDNCADTKLVLRELATAGIEARAVRVETEGEFRRALAEDPEIVLCDYHLPQFSALRALEILREIDPAIPFIIVSGSIGEEIAVAAMKLGATDYLLKDRLGRLGSAVRLALDQRKLREAERQANESLRLNEERYRLLIETLPHLVWMARPDGSNEFVNQRGAMVFGLPTNTLTGKPWLDLVHPDDRAAAAALWSAAIASPGPYHSEYRMRLPSGAYRWYSSQGNPLFDTKGQIEKWVGTWTDIDDRRRALDDLRRSEEEFRGAFEFTGVAMVLTDIDNRFTRVNAAFAALFGYDPSEMLGMTMAQITHPDDLAASYGNRQVLLSGERPFFQMEKRYRHRDGQLIWGTTNVSLLRDAEGRPTQYVGQVQDITERKRAEDALLLRDRAIRATTQGIVITDPSRSDNPIVYVSPAFEAMTGYSLADVIGRNCRLLQGKKTDPAALRQVRNCLAAEQFCTVELLNYRKDGTTFWNELSISPVRDTSGKLTHYVGMQSDVTERKRLEHQYLQSQKMEAIGQLAGGIAHDFNNLLTIINGYSELLLHELQPQDFHRDLIVEIHKAGTRSAGLTRQLLAFSRQQVLSPRVLDLNEIAAETERMLQRLIGEDIALTTQLAPDLSRTLADPGQIEQVLMNLAVNARDAMPRGGKIQIATRNAEIDVHQMADHPELAVGPYVVLAMSDSGFGMTADVKAKIFEPFFTTKGPGKGTGLGLATVYGIVRQSNGFLEVESEPGRGTTFRIYLPAVPGPAAELPKKSHPLAPPRGTETILVVEDEDGVRSLTQYVLSNCGYTVLDVVDGQAAIRIADAHVGPIHLLLTDVVMPGLGGPAVAALVAQRHPGIKVLFVSGYTDDAVFRHGVGEPGTNFLQKPYSAAELAQKIRAILDGPV